MYIEDSVKEVPQYVFSSEEERAVYRNYQEVPREEEELFFKINNLFYPEYV